MDIVLDGGWAITPFDSAMMDHFEFGSHDTVPIANESFEPDPSDVLEFPTATFQLAGL